MIIKEELLKEMDINVLDIEDWTYERGFENAIDLTIKRIGEVIDKCKCYLFEEIGEDGNRTGKQEPAILIEDLRKELGLEQTQTQEVEKK